MKCLLLDDHALFREALTMVLGQRHPELELHCGDTLAAGLALLATGLLPRLILLDLNLPDSRGLATLHSVLAAAPLARVVVLSADDRPQTVRAAIAAGVAGFIPKTADIDRVDAAVRTVLAGGSVLPELPPAPAQPCTQPGHALLSRGLTPRQVEVFQRVIEGKSNKLIARELGVSDSTVKTHVQAIFERLDIASRAQAMVVASQLGWTLPPPLR